jgi:hypothetical protein
MVLTTISVKGRWQGTVQLETSSETVFSLKQRISEASELPLASIQLLCGGKSLRLVDAAPPAL